MAKRDHVASVIKAIELIECFSNEEPIQSLSSLSKTTGFSKTTTHRLCSTLEHLGWLNKVAGGYRLGIEVFKVGSVAVNTLDLSQVAKKHLKELATVHREEVYMVVQDGTRAVCIERFEGRDPIHLMMLDVGKSLPLYVGGGPLALLAEASEAAVASYFQNGPLTSPTGIAISENDLNKQLRETRRRGYSKSEEDVTFGVAAFGSCIRDSSGAAVAAVSIAGLARDVIPRESELSRALLTTCEGISQQLGFVPNSSNDSQKFE